MKKAVGPLLTIVAVLVAVVVFVAVTAVKWYRLDARSVPDPAATLQGEIMMPTSYSWHVPLYGGLLHRKLVGEGRQPTDLGTIEPGTPLELMVPLWYENWFILSAGGEERFAGTLEAFTAQWDALTAREGAYTLTIVSTLAKGSNEGYGTLNYTATFVVQAAKVPQA